jgi:hypothetical protein
MTIGQFFEIMGNFVNQTIELIAKVLGFIGGVFALLYRLATLLPTSITLITATGIGLLSTIIIYKAVRKG